MKKLLLFLIVIYIGLVSKAQLTITNNTCVTIYVNVLAHNNTYSNCADMISATPYPVTGGGGQQVIVVPQFIGNAYVGSSYPTSYPVGSTGVFDGLKFGAEDGLGCNEYVAIGNCGSLSTTFMGSCHFCGMSNFTASWVELTPGTIDVTFNN